MDRIERKLTSSMESFGYDAAFFKYGLQMAIEMQKACGKSGSEIRYSVYRHWARELRRQEVGMETMDSPQYEYPAEACEYLRKLTGGPAKREKKDVKVVVSMDTFCRALAVPHRQ